MSTGYIASAHRSPVKNGAGHAQETLSIKFQSQTSGVTLSLKIKMTYGQTLLDLKRELVRLGHANSVQDVRVRVVGVEQENDNKRIDFNHFLNNTCVVSLKSEE